MSETQGADEKKKGGTSKLVAGLFGGLALFAILPILAIAVIGMIIFGGGEDEINNGYGCGSISDLDLSAAQSSQAAIIVETGHNMGVTREGIIVAITTALAESGLQNYANDGSFNYPAGGVSGMSAGSWITAANTVKGSLLYPHDAVGRDWDSVNAFQQRPSMGWGTVSDLMEPAYAAAAFFGGPDGPNASKGWPRGLLDIPGWETKSPGAAAQAVQISAFPDAYDKHVDRAQKIVDAIVGGACEIMGTPNEHGWTHPVPGYTRITGTYGEYRGRYAHAGDDFAAPAGTPILAANDGVVTRASCQGYQGRSPCNVIIDHGGGIQTWYVHMYPGDVYVSSGEHVQSGQHIGDVGSHGNSTGPHLHFEVHINGLTTDTLSFLKSVGITP